MIFFWKCIQNIQVLFFGKKIQIFYTINSFNTCVYYNITFVINNRVELFCWQTKQVTNFIGQRFKIPNMSYRNNERNVPHSFTAHFFLSNFNATTVANNSFVPDSFVFTAMTFVVFYGSENAFTKQSITFRLVSPVVYCLRF